MVVFLQGTVHLSLSEEAERKGGREVGQRVDRTGGCPSRQRDCEATLVKHLDCCSGAFISDVFVAQLFEMFNKAL